METMIKSVLRIVEFILVLLITALVGNVIASNISGSESAINFIMFVCALSWLAILYGLVSHFVAAIAIPIVALALDSAAVLFTFIGAIVFSAKLQAVNCSNVGRKPSDYIAFG
ncbi:hypothetical protein PC116_g31768, partial [Phytophthora cactorum]